MIKKIAQTAGLVALVSSLVGCGDQKDNGPLPQYTGDRYILNEDSVSVTDPLFMGEMPPKYLVVVHRMEHHGGKWDHYLRFEFFNQRKEINENSFEPEFELTDSVGAIAFSLDDLTRIDEGAYPHNGFDGKQVHTEGKKGGDGGLPSWDSYQEYVYMFFAEPSPYDIWSVYPGKTQNCWEDPFGMIICEGISNPEEVELNQEAVNEWYEEIKENGGKSFSFELCRRVKSSGGAIDNRGKECLYFTYSTVSDEKMLLPFETEHSSEHDNDDIRSLGTEEIFQGIVHPFNVLRPWISGIKE